MDFHSKVMDTFLEWFAATNTNGNIFSAANGVQNQALPLITCTNNIQQNNSPENGNNFGKTLSFRCIVESMPNAQYWDTTCTNLGSGHIEVDRRANVSVDTVFHNLVEVVLRIFGYPKEAATTAKGSILIENWKPIRLEKVALNPQKTVQDILGHVSSFVTLRIQILKTPSWPNTLISQMKEKLLQLLILQNRDYILSSGCPLDQMMFKSILQGSDYNTSAPSDDIIRKFDQWVANQSRQTVRPIPYPSPLGQFPYHLGSPTALHSEKNFNSGNVEDRVHPALQTIQSQYPTQKTRVRTSFDPELELPKLNEWFGKNQHPNKQQIQQYVNELNGLESRRGRKPLDVNNVVYWFKNARAAQKRSEVRSINSGQLNPLNGYRSDSHSPCDTAVTSKESLGSAQSCNEDDIEDDDNRSEGDEKEDSLDARPSGSPVAPLSLTTHKDSSSRNSSPVQEIKQEPPDKIESQQLLRDLSSEDKKNELRNSPMNHHEFESEDEDIDEDGSDSESVHKSNCEIESRNPLFSNSSPLSLIPRSVNNPVFPIVPSSMFSHNFPMFGINPYIPNMGMNANRNAVHGSPSPNANNGSPCSDERRNKRNRTFIDPVSEVPCLEKWFCENTHPSHGLIVQYTESLNCMPYRQKFPRLEAKNVQFWFKNRRAKCKRLKSSLYENTHIQLNNSIPTQDRYHQLTAALSGENYRNQE